MNRAAAVAVRNLLLASIAVLMLAGLSAAQSTPSQANNSTAAGSANPAQQKSAVQQQLWVVAYPGKASGRRISNDSTSGNCGRKE